MPPIPNDHDDRSSWQAGSLHQHFLLLLLGC
jgi:hypothetical protein